jgi:hypothetical protein
MSTISQAITSPARSALLTGRQLRKLGEFAPRSIQPPTGMPPSSRHETSWLLAG